MKVCSSLGGIELKLWNADIGDLQLIERYQDDAGRNRPGPSVSRLMESMRPGPDRRRPRLQTPVATVGSAFLLLACTTPPAPEPERRQAPRMAGETARAVPSRAAPATPAPPPVTPVETSLGVADTGIWSDLDARVQLALPGGLEPSRVTAQLDRDRALLVVSVDGVPTKPYPLAGEATLEVGDHRLALRPGDRAELAP